jgi:hypothetical protein
VKGIVGLALASTVLLVGCYTGPSADHFLAVVDELGTPDGWQVAQTVVRGPDQDDYCNPGMTNECPTAIRYFLTDTDLDGAYAQAKALISGVGFTVMDEATAGCMSGSSNGPPCGFFAIRGSDRAYVGVFHSPSEAGIDAGAPGDVTVVVHANE